MNKMKKLIAIIITGFILAGLSSQAALALPARLASVCQPNGTGCAKAGTYSGLNALISSSYSGFKVVWTSSVVQPYAAGVPLYWTVYVTYTNISSSSLTLSCPGDWTAASYVKEHMSGGSGDDGTVSAQSTTCSQNPDHQATVAPGGTSTSVATFHNVPWPGSGVSVTWGNAGTSPSVNPFKSRPASHAVTADNNGNWAGYLAQTGNGATQVNGTFVQPKINCARGESSSAGFWVGVSDHSGGGTIAQDGTSAFCYQGTPGYYLWWETVGRSNAQGGGSPVPVLNTNGQGVNVAPAVCKQSPKFTGTASPSLKQLAFLVNHHCVAPVKPGYTIGLAVTVSPHSYAVFSGYIPQTHFELNTTQAFSNVVTGGSEWIAETQHIGSGLSNFGRIKFSDCYAYTGTSGHPGEPISDFSDLKLNLIYDVKKNLFGSIVSYKTAASPGGLSGVTSFNNGTQDGFAVAWYSHGEPLFA